MFATITVNSDIYIYIYIYIHTYIYIYISGLHVGEWDEYYLLGCPAMYYVNFQGSRFYCLQFEIWLYIAAQLAVNV